MFEWDSSYSVNVQVIDAEHKNLFRLAGELHAAMLAGKGKDFIRQCLDRLVQYTSVHFAHEERLMQEHGFPKYLQHKQEHEALRERVLKLQNEFERGRVSMTVEVLQFLKNWLKHHIHGSDLQYAPYISGRIRPASPTMG